MIMIEMRAWKLRPGSDIKTIERVLKGSKVRLDYEVPGLQSDMSRETLINLIRAHNPDRTDKGVRARAGQLATLFNTVSKGDLAVVPRDKGKAIMIGKIISRPSVVSGTCVEIRVDWINSNVPLDQFEQDLQYSFMAIHKFCGVSRNNAPERLLQIANGHPDPGFSG